MRSSGCISSILHFEMEFKDRFLNQLNLPNDIHFGALRTLWCPDVILFMFSNNKIVSIFLLKHHLKIFFSSPWRFVVEAFQSIFHLLHISYSLQISSIWTREVHFRQETNQFNCLRMTKYLDALHWHQIHKINSKQSYLLFSLQRYCGKRTCVIPRDLFRFFAFFQSQTIR